jgi:hypothetical protein
MASVDRCIIGIVIPTAQQQCTTSRPPKWKINTIQCTRHVNDKDNATVYRNTAAFRSTRDMCIYNILLLQQ